MENSKLVQENANLKANLRTYCPNASLIKTSSRKPSQCHIGQIGTHYTTEVTPVGGKFYREELTVKS